MPLQMHQATRLPAQENVVRKAVSFATPGAVAKPGGGNKTGRRAFGDISNRKSSVTQQNTGAAAKTPAVVKPQSTVRVESKPAASSVKRQAVIEPIEIAYGPTGRQLMELYDSDDEFSITSIEKEGGLLTRPEREALLRQAAVQSRQAEQEHRALLWKRMEDETIALARRDGKFGSLLHGSSRCTCHIPALSHLFFFLPNIRHPQAKSRKRLSHKNTPTKTLS
jgi:hypothetical protein